MLKTNPKFKAPSKARFNHLLLNVYKIANLNITSRKPELFSLGSFISTGINVSFGTDGTASCMNPMVQLYRAITRLTDDGLPAGGFRPDDGISIETTLYCYTMGSARSIGMSHMLGSIETGKYADISVFDTNLLTASPDDIRSAKAIMVLSNGR